MPKAPIDVVRLNFDASAFFWLNLVIALMMFGVALGMRRDDFSRLFRAPKAPLVGLAAQLLLLPAFSYLLTLVLRPEPSMALGMLMVAACPGGNLSNVVTHLSGGNAAISVTMTAISTSLAVFTTPANLSLWGRLNAATAPLMREVKLSILDLLRSVATILGAPLVAGMLVRWLRPRWADRLEKPFRGFALLGLCAFIALALGANWKTFLALFSKLFVVVVVHNGLALGLGYLTGRLFKLPPADLRAVTIEVGIQNSGLGLILIFNFFDGLGGMATVAALWGVWHLVSGVTLALVWPRVSPIADPAPSEAEPAPPPETER